MLRIHRALQALYNRLEIRFPRNVNSLATVVSPTADVDASLSRVFTLQRTARGAIWYATSQADPVAGSIIAQTDGLRPGLYTARPSVMGETTNLSGQRFNVNHLAENLTDVLGRILMGAANNARIEAGALPFVVEQLGEVIQIKNLANIVGDTVVGSIALVRHD